MVTHNGCKRNKPGVLLLFTILTGAYRTVCAAYPQNYLSRKTGATVVTESKLTGPFEPDALLSDGPISKGRFAFAPVDQLRTFTVDLGQPRTFDRIQLGTSGNPGTIAIEVSSHSIDGPFKKLCETSGPVHFQILRLPVTTGRWLRFDFGRGSNRIGVHSVRIYKGYTHPGLIEVTKLLNERIKPHHPGLKSFRLHASSGNWRPACSELRAYFKSKHKPDTLPNPDCDLTRAKEFAAGRLNFAGLLRTDPLPIDWTWMKTPDWYEHKNFLNRGSPLGVMADACYHTGSPSWARRFREIFYDWIDENPKPGIMSGADYPAWRTLDTAARLSWLTSRFAEVTTAQRVDDELWANYLYAIWEHADYLKNDDFSGGNWLSTITSAVTFTAVRFNVFKDRRIWLEYGRTGFERNVLRDIYPDGKEMEDAPGYICMAYKGMLDTLETLKQEGIRIDPNVRLRLSKVQDFLAAVTQPNGIMPFIGDWGGYALSTAMKHFKRDDIRYILSKGKRGTAPSAASVHFPHGGWTIMRSPYTEKPYEHARHLVFKSSSGAHGHLDVLSITAYAFGRELLIDPGIRSYERPDIRRSLQTSYHNTVCIDNRNQPRIAGKTFDVLLYPYQAGSAPLVSTEFLTGENGSCGMTGLKVTAGKDTDYIFFAQPGASHAGFKKGEIQIEAEILLIRTSNGNSEIYIKLKYGERHGAGTYLIYVIARMPAGSTDSLERVAACTLRPPPKIGHGHVRSYQSCLKSFPQAGTR